MEQKSLERTLAADIIHYFRLSAVILPFIEHGLESGFSESASLLQEDVEQEYFNTLRDYVDGRITSAGMVLHIQSQLSELRTGI